MSDEHPEADPAEVAQEAYRLVYSGELVRARGLCERILASKPRHPPTLYVIGLIELQERRYAQASEALELAAKLEVIPDAWIKLASSRFLEGKAEQALSAADEAIALVPSAVDAHTARAAALHALGRFEQALAAGLEALRCDPASAIAWARVGAAQDRLGRIAEAHASFAKAAELSAQGKAYSIVSLEEALLERLSSMRPGLVASAEERVPPPAGTVPKRFVVFAACDASYFRKYAYNFARSFASHAGDGLLHLHVVDPDADLESRLDAFAGATGVARLRITTERSSFAAGTNTAAHAYYSCCRFLHLPELVRRYAVPVICIDVDAIVEHPLGELVDSVKGDVGLTQREPPHSPWLDVPAGLLVARPTPAGLGYLELVRNYILHFMGRGQFRWHLDQAALYCVLRLLQHPSAPRSFLGALGHRFFGKRSARFTPPSVTWLPGSLLAAVWQIGHDYDRELADPRFTRYSA